MPPVYRSPVRAAASRLAYVGVVALATLTNLHPDVTAAEVVWRLHRALDVAAAFASGGNWIDAARNVLLFVGYGAVWVATTRRTPDRGTVLTATVTGLLVSLTVETIQLVSPVRDSSIGDVITNTAGAFLGSWAALVVLAFLERHRERVTYVGPPAAVIAVSYGAAVLAEAFFPLLRAPTLPNLGDGIRQRILQGIGAFDPSSMASIPLTDLALYLPAGFLATAALAEDGAPVGRSTAIVAALGAALMVAVETVHTVALEAIDGGAVLVHLVAIALGALVAGRVLGRCAALPTRLRVVRFFAGYVAVVAAWSWRPFRLELSRAAMEEQFASDHWIPLRALASRGDLFSVTDVVAQCLLFVPFGAVLAVWPIRRRGPLQKLLPALYLSVVLELGKIAVADRFLDITHVLIQGAGAAIGYVAMRRAGYAPRGELLPERAPVP